MSNRTISRNPEGPGVLREVRPLHRALLLAMLASLLAVVIFWFVRYFTLRPQPNEGPLRLAVLPFSIITPEPSIEYLSIGIPDSLIARLSNIRQITVCPTDSILKFQKGNASLDEIKKELKADNILTGTIQKTADNLRINVQLVRTKDGVSLWSDRYDLPPANLLQLENQIAPNVGTKLKLTLTTDDRNRLYRRYTENGDAYNWYLRGRSELARHDKEADLAAIANFEKSLSFDSNYALARAALALASAEIQLRYAQPDEVKQWGDRAEAEAEKALQIDGTLAEAHEALAAVYSKTDFKWDGTIRESRKALDLNPGLQYPHYYLASAFHHLGLLDLASKEIAAGLQNGGLNKWEAYQTQGVVALSLGNYPEAVARLEEAQRLNGGPLQDASLAHAYFAMKKYPEAERALNQVAASSSAPAVARAEAARAAFLAAQGDQATAKQIADAVASAGYMDHHVAYDLGAAYTWLHQNQEALSWLRKSMDSGFPSYPHFAQDPLLQPLQSDPEFRKLLGELRDKWNAARRKYE